MMPSCPINQFAIGDNLFPVTTQYATRAAKSYTPHAFEQCINAVCPCDECRIVGGWADHLELQQDIRPQANGVHGQYIGCCLLAHNHEWRYGANRRKGEPNVPYGNRHERTIALHRAFRPLQGLREFTHMASIPIEPVTPTASSPS